MTNIDDRPTKKRRFFSDDGGVAVGFQGSSNIPSSRPTSATSSTDTHDSSQTDPADIEHDGPSGTASHGDFDEETFRAVVGEETLSQEVVDAIKEAAGSNLERAVNMYFEGSWKSTLAARQTQPVSSRTIQGWTSSARSTPDVAPVSRSSPPQAGAMTLKKMPHERYVGSFGVAGWTTRSGTNLLTAGEAVRIERSRIQPKTKLGRGGKLVQMPSRKSDVVARFTNVKGEELGRLPEETAKYVSALIDQKVCRFEGHAIFAPEHVRVNDTVYLQLRCYMLKTAFEASAFVKPEDDNRATGIFEQKESNEEKDLRLRQVALVKLFDEMNLQPTSSNETVAKHKKQGLLRAAEMAEQYDQEAANKPKTGSTPPPEAEAEDGIELEDDQLDALYQKAQTFDFDTPVAEPAPTFILELRKYQKQALYWMLSKERDQQQASTLMNPLYESYSWPIKDADDKSLPGVEGQESFYVNLYSGELSLDFPVQESHCLGGILADEMGLGKTIEMFSLMHSNQSEVALAATARALSKDSVVNLPRLPQTSSSMEPAPCTTLVVSPMSLLSQWESEAVKSSKPGTMRSLVYYGNEKATNLQTLCSAANAANAPNVIITSYGVVLSEFNQVASSGGDRGSHGGLFSVEFFRVILDEAHTIKNRQAKTSKACYELAAKHRWVLTGTPIVNRLEDLFSLVRFLRVEPWSNFSFWKTFITVPFESRDFVRALNVVQTVLEPLVLRRTKDM
jgi:DNA repair protein RAD5